jgi:hypothetical protein
MSSTPLVNDRVPRIPCREQDLDGRTASRSLSRDLRAGHPTRQHDVGKEKVDAVFPLENMQCRWSVRRPDNPITQLT